MAKPRDPMFLIIAGAITALFLPFAIAFPPTPLAKALTVLGLVIAASATSALVLKIRRRGK
jgi:hypothetical protein